MLLLAQGRVSGVDEDNPGGLMPVPGSVCAKLKALFQKYYPKATFTNEGLNRIHIEYEMMTFETPYTSPPRGKQMSPTHRGPKKGGIECDVSFAKGKYNGQIALMPRGLGRPGALLTNNNSHFEIYSGPFYRPENPLPRNGNSQYELLIDRQVYKVLLMAPYSAKRDAYLCGSVSYPPDASEDFLKEFCRLMDDFGKDAD